MIDKTKCTNCGGTLLKRSDEISTRSFWSAKFKFKGIYCGPCYDNSESRSLWEKILGIGELKHV